MIVTFTMSSDDMMICEGIPQHNTRDCYACSDVVSEQHTYLVNYITSLLLTFSRYIVII